MFADKQISVVIPAYNEEKNIAIAVNEAVDICSGLFGRVEVIAVDDGSSDGTAGLLAELSGADPRVRPIYHDVNRGYGRALRSGFEAATGDYIFLTDGDNQFDLREIERLMPLMERADIAVGYRIKRRDPLSRSLNAFIYRSLVRLLFGLRVRDIDCAFKLFRREVLESINLTSEGAVISTELLVKAMRAGYAVTETGVHHFPRRAGRQTGARPGVVFKAFLELISLWAVLRRRRQETRPSTSVPRAAGLTGRERTSR